MPGRFAWLVLLVVAVVPARAAVELRPSGGDDTGPLRAALEHAAAGDEIRLAAGTFLLRPVAVAGFSGTLRGAGRDATILRVLDDSNVSRDEPFTVRPPGLDNPWPVLLTFVDGAPVLADLSIVAAGPAPTRGWFTERGQRASGLFAAVLFTGTRCDSRVERVGVLGNAGDLDGYNLGYGVLHAGWPLVPGGREGVGGTPLSGSHAVDGLDVSAARIGLGFHNLERTTVETGRAVSNRIDATIAALSIGPVRDGTIRLAQNAVTNSGTGILVGDVADADVAIERNLLGPVDVVGIHVFQEFVPPRRRSRVALRDNVIAVEPFGAAGIWLLDQGAAARADGSASFTVTGNRVESGGVDALWIEDAAAVVVAGNVLTGSGPAAIRAGRRPSPRDGAAGLVEDALDVEPRRTVLGAVLADNDFASFSSPLAPIVLERGATRCVVFGAGIGPRTVLDLGRSNRVALPGY